jgi:Tfp pilus assembly protein PilV
MMDLHSFKKLFRRNELSGFTMLEALVVFSVFVLITLALVGLSLQLRSLYNLGEAQFDSVGSARNAVNAISFYTKQAQRVVVSQTVNSVLYTTGPNTLVLQVPAIGSGGDIIDSTFDYVVFATSSDILSREIEADAASVRNSGSKFIANNLSSLIFSYNNTDLSLVNQVSITVSSTATSARQQAEQYQTADFLLRNY